MTATTEPQTITIPEVARRIGVSRNTLYRAIYETGEVLPGVPAFKVRQSWRVSTHLLERFLEAGGAPTPAAS